MTQNHLLEIYQLLHFHAFSSAGLPTKTITVASQPPRDLATADPATTVSLGAQRPVPSCHTGLFVLSPPTSQPRSCLRPLYLHFLWLELGWSAPSSDTQCRLPLFINSSRLSSQTFLLNTLPARHSLPSSHLTFSFLALTT